MATRLVQPQTATVADGTATWAFVPPTQGYAASVSLSVPTGSPGSSWVVYLNGVAIGGMSGATPFGPVYVVAGDQLSVSGPWSGGTPPSAVAVGTIGPVGEPSPTPPVIGG